MNSKKLLALLITLCLVVISVVAITSCNGLVADLTNKIQNDSDGVNEENNDDENVEEDNTDNENNGEGDTPGGDDVNGDNSGDNTEDNTETHTHTLTKAERVEANCTKTGNIEYYTCSGCEKKYADENATAEITDVVIPKNDNHVGGTEIRGEKAPTEEEEGYTGDTYCLGCGEKIKDGTSINALNHVHAMSKVEAIEKTCTENGNIEYYTCSKCGKYYTDENGTNEITLEDTIIKASHKLTYAEANDATCKEDGNVAYYTCSSCSEKFSDADATNKITDVVIPKNDNHVGGTEIRDVKEATEEEEGYTGDTYCLGCGEKIADGESTDKLPHTHSMIKTEKTEATCTTDGNIEYYTCSKCGKYYTDENGTQEITLTDTVVKAGHNFENNKCTECGKEKTSEGLKFTLNSDQTSYSVTGIGTCKDTDIIIPKTYNNLPVTSIGGYAFYECTSLTSVTIPNSVTSIGEYAFSSCSKLQEVHISDIEAWCNISFGNEYANPLNYANNLYLNGELVTELVIPDTVKEIKKYAFEDCRSLTSVAIPDSVTSIGSSAFRYCYKLVEVYNLSDLTITTGSEDNGDVGRYALKVYNSLDIPSKQWKTEDGFLFYEDGDTCYLLGYTGDKTEITLPENCRGKNYEIYKYAFYGNDQLIKITIPNSVTSIGNQAFWGCDSLKCVTIGNGVTSIGSSAFYNCENLTNITIPNSITSIDGGAFANCHKLVEVYNLSDLTITAGSNDNGYVGYYALNVYTDTEGQKKTFETEDGFLFYEDGDTCYLLGYTGDKTEITLPESCNGKNYEIYKYAFYYNDNITKVIIPDSVTSIGYEAFYSCYSLTSVTIPDSVTSIGNSAFRYCSSLTSVTIPDSVTSIGGSAFSGCDSLTSITIPFIGESKDAMGYKEHFGYIFGYSSSSSKPESYHYYDSSTKKYYTYDIPQSLKTVIISNSVTSIVERAFYNCDSLTSITIPDSVTSIGGDAFYGCTSLTSITIPFVGSSKDATGYEAHFGYIFGYYSSLESDKYHYKQDEIFGETYDDRYYTYYIPQSLKTVIIGNSVTSIGRYAFYNCDSLTSITIGNSVTYIDYHAFYNCYHLVEVYNLSDLTITAGSSDYGCIGYYAISVYNSLDIPSKQWNTEDGFLFYEDGDICYLFGYTGDKTKITLPESCNGKNYGIYKYAFYGNDKLKKVTIPGSVTSIGDYAFYKCTSFTSVTIPDSVTSIGGSAFSGCDSLTSITIGDSVTSIGDWAFYNCDSLTSITIGDRVTSIGGSAFRYCSSLTSVTIPDSVTSIGGSAFYYCSSLTSVSIGNSVTSIGAYAFYNCDSLTSITIGDSVTSIGDFAFFDCTSLKKVYISDIGAWCNISFGFAANPLHSGASLYLNGELVTELVIPDGVTSIPTDAFYYQSSIISVSIPDSVTSIGNSAFYNCISLKEVHISDIGAWCNISFADSYANPLEYADNLYLNGELVTELVIPDNVKEIKASAFYDCDSLTSITIPNSVTSIGSYAFDGCNSLTSITIPDSVTSIGDFAFCNCTSLTSVSIGNSVTSIGNYAFAGCNSLTSITIPDSVTSIIGDYAFCDCTSLTSVSIGNNVTSIGEDAFYNCTSLTSVSIGNSVTSIGEDAFYNCTSLTSVTIPDSVTSIGNYAFEYCSRLVYNEYDNAYYLGNAVNPYVLLIKAKSKDITSCSVHNNTKLINSRAFYNCENLTKITIPDSVTSIGSSAFGCCYSLTSLYFKGSADEWSEISINNYNTALTDAIRYYYSEGKPTEEGNFWYYNEDGKVVIWG